ncbi:MAG: ABC transporter permease [Deltaproteobacteria bacterium]|nr:ABC transporter permease [Deltaproteobacteria bacterium]
MIGTIARVTLKRISRGQAVWVALGISLIPVIVAMVLRQAAPASDRAEFTLDLYVVEMFVIAIVPALFVASSIGEEIEDKTITYLWSRPLPRWHVIAGKLVALAPIAAALVLVGWLLAIQIAEDRLAPLSTIIGIVAASLAVSFVAAGIGTLAPKHGMALTIIYMLLFDVPIGEIPASLQVLSITHQARLLAGIAVRGVRETDRLAPAITLAVLGGVWLAVGLWKIRRTEA